MAKRPLETCSLCLSEVLVGWACWRQGKALIHALFRPPPPPPRASWDHPQPSPCCESVLGDTQMRTKPLGVCPGASTKTEDWGDHNTQSGSWDRGRVVEAGWVTTVSTRIFFLKFIKAYSFSSFFVSLITLNTLWKTNSCFLYVEVELRCMKLSESSSVQVILMSDSLGNYFIIFHPLFPSLPII